MFNLQRRLRSQSQTSRFTKKKRRIRSEKKGEEHDSEINPISEVHINVRRSRSTSSSSVSESWIVFDLRSWFMIPEIQCSWYHVRGLRLRWFNEICGLVLDCVASCSYLTHGLKKKDKNAYWIRASMRWISNNLRVLNTFSSSALIQTVLKNDPWCIEIGNWCGMEKLLQNVS